MEKKKFWALMSLFALGGSLGISFLYDYLVNKSEEPPRIHPIQDETAPNVSVLSQRQIFMMAKF